MKKELEPFLAMFKQEVDKRSASIDPDNEYCWLSLTVGWAIAKGMKPNDAHEFASYVRYNTDMA